MRSYKYLLKSKKIKITSKDQEIEKGSYKVITTPSKNRKLIGTGIYDKDLFLKMNKERGSGKIFEEKGAGNFYVKLHSPSPSIISDYSLFKTKRNSLIVQNFLEYSSVYTKDGIIEIEKNKDIDNLPNEFYFGEEAALVYLAEEVDSIEKMNRAIFTDEDKTSLFHKYFDWIEDNNVSEFLISDYSLREPILVRGKKEAIQNDINLSYEKLFDSNSNNTIFLEGSDRVKRLPFLDFVDFYEIRENISDRDFEKLRASIPTKVRFLSSRNIFIAKRDVEEEMKDLLSRGKKSIIKKEGISQKLSGAIRGTIVPNSLCNEDEIEIGTSFADSLFPHFIGLWKDAGELNSLIKKGVMKIDKEVYRYNSEISEDVKLRTKERNPYKYERMNYFYPWFEEDYFFLDEEKLKEVKEEVRLKRLKYYEEKQSDIPYLVIVNRPPTISQLSMLSMKPVFRDSIGLSKGSNEKSCLLEGISSPETAVDSFKCESSYTDVLDDDILVSLEESINDLYSDEFIEIEEYDFKPYEEDIIDTVYKEDILGISPLICDGMNADFDGDLLLVISLFTIEANKAAMRLIPSRNFKTVTDGEIRNTIPKEFITAMEYIYKQNPELALKISGIINSK